MAKKVNNYWDIKTTKTGRKRIFDDPTKMWLKACEYFDWCVVNPLVSIDYKGKDALPVEINNVRAFTIEGLCLFMGVSHRYFDDWERKTLLGKDDELSQEFSSVIQRIRATIKTQKFENAAANLLNPMIISRDLGLVERKQVEAQVMMNSQELENKVKELSGPEQEALLSLAEKLGYEDADFEEL